MPHHRPPGRVRAASTTILLTGATGFLGGELVRTLVASGDVRLICPVRARSQAEAERRGRAVTTSPQVTWLRAELTERDLGLDPTTLTAVLGAIDEIIHCAASTRFDLPLGEANRINVEATGRLLRLATAAGPRFRRFHHVSTAYAAGLADGPVGPHHLPADRAGNFRNDYERSKARAERLLRAQTRVPITIHRPSIITGHSRTGATTNWNVVYEPMRHLARGNLPVLPVGGRAVLDLVAVDHVARGIAALADQLRHSDISPRLTAHHLTAAPTDRPLDVPGFVGIIGEVVAARSDDGRPPACRLVSTAQWRALAAGAGVARRLPRSVARTGRGYEARRWGVRVERLVRGFAPFEPYARVDTVFDNAADAAILSALGIEMPPAVGYTARLVRHALDVDFGRRPAERLEMAG